MNALNVSKPDRRPSMYDSPPWFSSTGELISPDEMGQRLRIDELIAELHAASVPTPADDATPPFEPAHAACGPVDDEDDGSDEPDEYTPHPGATDQMDRLADAAKKATAETCGVSVVSESTAE